MLPGGEQGSGPGEREEVRGRGWIVIGIGFGFGDWGRRRGGGVGEAEEVEVFGQGGGAGGAGEGDELGAGGAADGVGEVGARDGEGGQALLARRVPARQHPRHRRRPVVGLQAHRALRQLRRRLHLLFPLFDSAWKLKMTRRGGRRFHAGRAFRFSSSRPVRNDNERFL